MPLLLRVISFLNSISTKLGAISKFFTFTFWADIVLSIIQSVTDKIGRVGPALAAYMALIISITIGYFQSVQAVLTTIDRTVPEIVLQVWGWVMPDNALNLLSTYYAAKLIKWAHVKYIHSISYRTDIVLR